MNESLRGWLYTSGHGYNHWLHATNMMAGKAKKPRNMRGFLEFGRPEWTRTIDLCHVKAAL